MTRPAVPSRLACPCLAFTLLVALAAAAFGLEEHTMITDFTGGDDDLAFFVVNDDVMGGRSEGAFAIEDGVLVFAGRTNTDGGGFASIRSRPRALELGDARGVHLRLRGDGRTYSVTLRTDATWRGQEIGYHADLATDDLRGQEAWQVAYVPFARFRPRFRGRALSGPPLAPERARSIGLMINDGKDGPFRIEVDEITAYEPFAMDAWRWKRRPLLVFAPSADDPRLQRQLERVEATREAFDDRDMALVVVAGEGASRAGPRPLEPEAIEALRARYDVAPDAFAVILVGKDGGVKRRESEPVDLAGLYEQIDAMPMRQQERRERDR